MGTNELIIIAASREKEVEVIMIMDVVTGHDEKVGAIGDRIGNLFETKSECS
jgi:hypothetical protein